MQAYAEPGAADAAAIDEAFERLYRDYARDVYRYSLAVLRNPADAEDITQTTFLNAYRAYRRGEEPRSPRNWLITIAHNACRSRHLRAVRRPREVPFEESVAAIPVAAEETPKLEELLEALGQLPFNQRAALVMRELEGRSYAEIAETLETSVAAVETLIFRARRALRRDRSLLGVLAPVQLPPSLASFVGGGGGAAIGSGLLAKAALLVAAGIVAGAAGPIVTHHHRPAAIELRPLTVAAAKRATVATAASPAIRVLRGPIVVVKKQGRTFVVTQSAVEVAAGAAPTGATEIGSVTTTQAQQPTETTVAEASPPPSASAAQPATAAARSATTAVTQAVTSATSAADQLPVSSPVSTPTTAAPPLPVDTSPVTNALPPTPTVTLPDLP